jgi:HSP20 family protein
MVPFTTAQMDRLIARFVDHAGELATFGAWAPRMEIVETKEAFVVTLEVPGMDAKDIKVNLRNGVLAVTMAKVSAGDGIPIPVGSD